MPLTDAAAKQAKPRDKDYKLTDGGGMFLLVKKDGSKYWRLKYRFDGKETLVAARGIAGVFKRLNSYESYVREQIIEKLKTEGFYQWLRCWNKKATTVP